MDEKNLNAGHDQDNDEIQLTQNEGAPVNKVSVTINIDNAVKEKIIKYSRSDTSRELAGVLLGHYKEKNEGEYVVNIEANIEALYTEGGKSNVTFTHKSWDYIDKVKEKKYPDLKIVGWFHTHPGFGIFLSEHDKFIQNNFFNLPWQVAYVIDPVQNQDGFFGFSEENRIIKLPFKGYDKELSAKKKEHIAFTSNNIIAINKKNWPSLVFITVIFVLIISFGFNIYMFMEYRKAKGRMDVLQNNFVELEASYKEIKDEYILLEDEYEKIKIREKHLKEKIRSQANRIIEMQE
jgi:proteasome lid subunit RPN8/RPN11